MAANRDLPAFFASVHPHYKVPYRAALAVGIVVAAVMALTDLRSAIGFSAFTLLTDYAITNTAAWRLDKSERRWPRGIALAGLIGCTVLALNLPLESVIDGGMVLLTGAGVFGLHKLLRYGYRG